MAHFVKHSSRKKNIPLKYLKPRPKQNILNAEVKKFISNIIGYS